MLPYRSCVAVLLPWVLGMVAPPASAGGEPCSVKDRSAALAVVICPPHTAQAALKAAGMAACKGREVCNAWIWEDPAKAPAKAPATDTDLPKASSGAARAIWIQDSQNLIELRKLK